MKCETAKENILLASYGELPDEYAIPLEQHLDGCDDCRSELEALRELDQHGGDGGAQAVRGHQETQRHQHDDEGGEDDGVDDEQDQEDSGKQGGGQKAEHGDLGSGYGHAGTSGQNGGRCISLCATAPASRP